MLMMKKPKDLEFEPVDPKNVLLASVLHGISCFFYVLIEDFAKIRQVFKFEVNSFYDIVCMQSISVPRQR
jgi:hypothetical protein